MGLANKILPHYTYEDWLHWEGRWELIEGSPIAMSPMAKPKHQRVAATLRMEFGMTLRNSKCKKCCAYDPIDYKISEDTILQPDILIVCGEINKPYLDFPPSLVAEILSPSTALRDRNTKFEIYQQQGVAYYLIVDADKETIEIYKLVDNTYRLQPFDKNYHFELKEDCKIDVAMYDIW